jgi:hypothetical protein
MSADPASEIDVALEAFVGRLGILHEALIECAVKLRAAPSVEQVSSNVTVRSYRSGPVIEGYVDIEVSGGIGLAWTFDLRPVHSQWVPAVAIVRNAGSEQETLETFQLSPVVSAELTRLLDSIGAIIKGSVDRADLDELSQRPEPS